MAVRHLLNSTKTLGATLSAASAGSAPFAPSSSLSSLSGGYQLAWDPENLEGPVRPGKRQEAAASSSSGGETESKKQVRLFEPLKLRELTLDNRIVVSPMCQYCSPDGYFTDHHLVHLGQFALGGAGLIIAEASAVTADGRITPYDAGIWKDEHIEGHQRVVAFCHAHGVPIGVQLSHAGRKASTRPPYFRRLDAASTEKQSVQDADGGWQPSGPSPVAWSGSYRLPHELSEAEIGEVVAAFAAAAVRADAAGYDVVEIHGAHGYLIASFLSPISNQRTDRYGGSFENRVRLALEVTEAVRQHWPGHKPLFFRVSSVEWLPSEAGGWTIDDTLRLTALLEQLGVDVIDCSSGGNSPAERPVVKPGYQVPFAAAVKRLQSSESSSSSTSESSSSSTSESSSSSSSSSSTSSPSQLKVAAVGLITQAQQAEDILVEGQADLVLLAREFLRDPHFPLRAARELGVDVSWLPQYSRGRL